MLVAILVPTAGGGATAAAAEDLGPGHDLCLEVSSDVMPVGAWEQVVEAVSSTVASRTALFPDPTLALTADPAQPGSAGTPARLSIDSGRAGAAPADASMSCGDRQDHWLARFGRDFLQAGADRMLAEAPTTPGIDSEVVIEWYPEQTRLQTMLTFAGPLDIPNGTCWVDDALSIDATSGSAVASGEQGLETSLFAEGACGRFFDHLPDGGAGEQAITLLPTEVTLDDGRTLRFIASDVTVDHDGVTVGGSVEVR